MGVQSIDDFNPYLAVGAILNAGETMRHTSILTAVCLMSGVSAHAEDQPEPWPRHTIDNSSKGADGVRLGDINGDGQMDIVTGWEEGGIVRLYLNPGPEKAKDEWPMVTIGQAKNVEDAVFVDLDNDGTLDVASSCEGKTKTMFVHWGPTDKAKLLDADAWKTEPIPVTAGQQQWMYCLPMQVDGKHGVDLIVGSKGKGAAVGWLVSPEDPRDLSSWKYNKIRDAGWVMSLESLNRGRSLSYVLITDRKGPTRGMYLMGYVEDDWVTTDIDVNRSEYMFASVMNGRNEVGAAASRDGFFYLYSRFIICRSFGTRRAEVPNPFGVKHGKAVAVGSIDADSHADFVVSSNTQGQTDKPGVAWVKVLPDTDPKDWPAYDISGIEGKKFDRIELIDMDGDGDLDVLTCEEADNLGVIWYENPHGPVKP